MNPFVHRHGAGEGSHDPGAGTGPGRRRRAGHAGDAGQAGTDLPVVALVGRPNVGKSTILGRATGRFVETSNAPGTTVAVERGRVGSRSRGSEAWLVDLPGTPSLHAAPAGEPFWQVLARVRPDAIVVVVDAGDLARHLPLVLEVRDLGLPMVVAANLADEARRRGRGVDGGRLSQLLVAPVIETVARDPAHPGTARAIERAVALARRRRAVRTGDAVPRATTPAPVYGAMEARISATMGRLATDRSLGAATLDAPFAALDAGGVFSRRGAATLALGAGVADPAEARGLERARVGVAARWARASLRVDRDLAGRQPLADRLARLATSPFPGLPAFALVTAASLLAMVAVGGALAGLLTDAWTRFVSPVVTAAVTAVVPSPAIAEGLLWGLDGGLLAMLSVGIPYILTFYLVLAALEDSGYLTSAAVLTDRLFNGVGLPGRAAIPILAATGCNVPAIYGTRILATRRERVLASFLVALTPCSATSAVVVAAIAPASGIGAALGAFALVAVIAIAAGVGANRMIPGRQPPTVLELAPLRLPVPAAVVAKAWARFRAFLVTAAPLMIVGSILLGSLWSLGLVAPVGALVAPLAGFLGLPAFAVVALGFGFLRKELALQLLIALAVAEIGPAAADLGTFMSPGQLAVFAVVTAFSVPCIATVASMTGELGARATAAISAGTIAIAIAVGAALARVLGVA